MKCFRTTSSGWATITFIAIALLALMGTSQGATLRVSEHGSLIDLEAHDVPLFDVLKAISEKTGLTLKVGTQLTEPVSCDLRAATLEEAVKRLLGNRSYALSYRKADDGRVLAERLTVLGHATREADSPPGPSVSVVVPPIDPPLSGDVLASQERPPAQLKLERVWFGQQFDPAKMLWEQVAATPTEEESFARGILITDLPKDNPLRKIGIDVGDVISLVDGRPVQSSEELLQILSSLHNGHPTVRIERWRNASPDPIYLELQ